MLSSYVVWAANPVLLGLLLYRGYLGGMLSKYRIFYGYILLVLAISFLRLGIAAAFGRDSVEYTVAYYGPTFVMPFFQFAIIWSVYSRVFGLRQRSAAKVTKPMVVVGLITLPLVVRMGFSHTGDFFYHFHLITLFMQVVSCLFVCRKILLCRDTVRAGQNMVGILMGIGLMVGFQAVNFAFYVIWRSSDTVFWFFVPFIYVFSLAVMVYFLWNYEPVQEVQPQFDGVVLESWKG